MGVERWGEHRSGVAQLYGSDGRPYTLRSTHAFSQEDEQARDQIGSRAMGVDRTFP